MESERVKAMLTCADAIKTFSEVIGIPFGDYMTARELDSLANSSNKGVVGQLMEILLGKQLDTQHLDFADGEMKTATTDEFGEMPSQQSICVTNVGRHVDDMLDLIPYRESWVAEKIRHSVFIGVCRPDNDNPAAWFITEVLDCDFENDPRLSGIYGRLELEYDELCLRSLEMVMETGHLGGCAKGLRYIEHRPKSSGRTVSGVCGGAVVCDKVKAVYLKRWFFNDVRKALAA